MIKRVIVLGVLSLFVSVSAALGSGSADTLKVWQSIRESTLDFERAVAVTELGVDMGSASLELYSGLLVPARTIEGRTTEIVFVGDAVFLLGTDDPLEQDQLELFTGRKALQVNVQHAVLVVGDEEIADVLLGRDPATDLDQASQARAGELYTEWVSGAVRRGFGADGAQLRTILGDRLFDGFFMAWCGSEDLGDFYYALDPGEVEQITLGQFVPIELDDREEHRFRKIVKRQQRKGRLSKLNIDDLGNWDTWVSMSRPDSAGSTYPGGSGFESEHYTIEVALEPAEQTLRATSNVRVRAEWGGSRVLKFDLFRDMEVASVTGADGEPLPWIHTDDGLLAILPEPLAAGATTEVTVDYEGVVLAEYQKGIYFLLDTYSWYPRIGDVDRATYGVTLRWPKKHQVLASGRVVESGVDKGVVWERRDLDVPAIAFSFEVGDFEIHRITAGDVEITVGIARVDGALKKNAKQDTLEHLAAALPFFEERFGDYPLDYMTVATVPRNFSQGFLGFVTLSHSLLREWTGWRIYDPDNLGDTQLMETVAHELSHQWWGNKVGWAGYRDQWLSEALADFSAMLYAAERAERKAVYLARHARQWRGSLVSTLQDGRSVESLGPVVMGSRLGSSKSSRAYQAIVYQKGSVIFNMLAQALGVEPFSQMLGALADAVDNRVIDTRTFLNSMERMSGADLSRFASSFVYGTGIPEVYYTYRFTEGDDGGWLVEGKARQVTPGRFDYVLRRTDDDAWHVDRAYTPDVNVEEFALAVPFQVSLTAKKDELTEEDELYREHKTTTQRGFGGRIVLSGEETQFQIPIPEKPDRFWFDQRGEVLIKFYSELFEPKRMLRYRAVELANAKRFDEAEELYRKALAAPLYSEAHPDPPSEKQIRRVTKIQDSLIQIALARMYLDMERDEDAATALGFADGLLTGQQKRYFKTSRMVLRCHLAVRAGDFEAAYREMEKAVYLDFPFRYGDTMSQSARRRKFTSRSRVALNGLGYTVFAVAAYETGNTAVARQAAKEAAERGAVVAPLMDLIGEPRVSRR